jgi:hypothetical protein
VHHSTFLTENPKQAVTDINFYYSVFKLSSTCFGRHTAHQQEPNTIQAASRTLPDNVQQLYVRQPFTYAKPEAACAVLGS